MDLENNKAQMRKGILEYCILSVLSRNSCYASDIIKELKEAEVIVVEGTLYPLLTSCLLYTSPSPRDRTRSRMPSSA